MSCRWSWPGVRSRAAAATGDVADVRRAAVASGTPTLLPGHPVLRRPRPASTEEAEAPQSLWATGSWSEGTLRLEIALDEGDQVDHATLRHVDSGVDWRLPARHDAGHLEVEVDPGTLADGEPLGRGRWVVDVHASGAPGDSSSRPVAWRQTPGSALLSGVVVTAARGKRQRVVLDVGATRRSPLADLSADGAAIEESARGTLLRWPLPFVDVVGEGSWPATLDLGGFPVTARVRSADDSASLEAWLSGLRSRVPVSMELAGSPAYATGFDLDISAIGLMALVPHEDEERTSPRPGGRAVQRGGRARSLAGRLRRRLNRSAG